MKLPKREMERKKRQKKLKPRIPVAPPSKRHKSRKDYKRSNRVFMMIDTGRKYDGFIRLMRLLGLLDVKPAFDKLDEFFDEMSFEAGIDDDECWTCGGSHCDCEVYKEDSEDR